MFGDVVVGVYFKVVMYMLVDVIEDVLSYLFLFGVDCLVVVGGGFIVGLGKVFVYWMGLL